MIEYQVKVC